MHTNPVTGEVTFELAGKTYTLHATMKRLAEYQARLAVPGMAVLSMLLGQLDARAIYWGLVTLCSNGDAKDFDGMLLAPHLKEASEAIGAALQAGLPEPAGESANPQQTMAIN